MSTYRAHGQCNKPNSQFRSSPVPSLQDFAFMAPPPPRLQANTSATTSQHPPPQQLGVVQNCGGMAKFQNLHGAFGNSFWVRREWTLQNIPSKCTWKGLNREIFSRAQGIQATKSLVLRCMCFHPDAVLCMGHSEAMRFMDTCTYATAGGNVYSCG